MMMMTASMAFVTRKYPYIDDDDDDGGEMMMVTLEDGGADGEMMMTMTMTMMKMTMVMMMVTKVVMMVTMLMMVMTMVMMVTLEDGGGGGEMTASLTFVGCISPFSSCTCCESPTDKKMFRVDNHRCFSAFFSLLRKNWRTALSCTMCILLFAAECSKLHSYFAIKRHP